MTCQGEPIEYGTNIIVDRQTHRAYLLGVSANIHVSPESTRLYTLCIDYDQTSTNGGVPLTLYFTDPLQVVPDCMPLLTPEGNLVIAGGLTEGSNFTPSNAVWLLRLGRAGSHPMGYPLEKAKTDISHSKTRCSPRERRRRRSSSDATHQRRYGEPETIQEQRAETFRPRQCRRQQQTGRFRLHQLTGRLLIQPICQHLPHGTRQAHHPPIP